MRIDIITIFPASFTPLFESIPARAQEKGLVSIQIHDLRDYTEDRHRTVDDTPYGGGRGMVMKCEPIFKAVRALREASPPSGKVVLMCPQGRPFTQRLARELAQEERLILVCGHYEGIDERVRIGLADLEISIGDYVLTGGELPAMVVADAVIRLLPGAIQAESLENESFTTRLLDYPHYTRPQVFETMEVPEVLLAGNHAKIEKWRHQEAVRRTLERRPDLLNPLPWDTISEAHR